MGVGKPAVITARVVVQGVLDTAEARGLLVVLVGHPSQPDTRGGFVRQADVDVEEREVVDPGVEVRHLQTEAVSLAQQRILEDIETELPVVRGLRLEEGVGIHHLGTAAAMRATGHEYFGNRRCTPAAPPSRIELQPVHTRFD